MLCPTFSRYTDTKGWQGVNICYAGVATPTTGIIQTHLNLHLALAIILVNVHPKCWCSLQQGSQALTISQRSSTHSGSGDDVVGQELQGGMKQRRGQAASPG
jgi:hypothetical protein